MADLTTASRRTAAVRARRAGALPRAAVVVESTTRRCSAGVLRASVAADAMAEMQLRYPDVPIVFCDNRKLGQEWTFRFLGATAAWWQTEQEVVRGPATPDPARSTAPTADVSTPLTGDRSRTSRRALPLLRKVAPCPTCSRSSRTSRPRPWGSTPTATRCRRASSRPSAPSACRSTRTTTTTLDPFGGNLAKAIDKAAAATPPADPATAPKTGSAAIDPVKVEPPPSAAR